MQKKGNLARNKIRTSTQQFLDISEIKEDIVIMRDGTMRAALIVSSLNFALKSEEEQDAIISSYISFLNNITFPLQIVIQSRELNIDAYLAMLEERQKTQTNELLKIQTTEYMHYIGELISMSQIMSKRFYVIVPYNPLADKKKKFSSRFLDIFKPASIIRLKEEKFLKQKNELSRLVENVTGGLAAIGLQSAQIDTQGLIELYYNSYNPDSANSQKLADISKLRVAEDY